MSSVVEVVLPTRVAQRFKTDKPSLRRRLSYRELITDWQSHHQDQQFEVDFGKGISPEVLLDAYHTKYGTQDD